MLTREDDAIPMPANRRGWFLPSIVLAIGISGILPSACAARPRTASEVLADDVDGRNITAEFDALYHRSKGRALLREEQKAALRRYDIFFVPGFLTALYVQIGELVKQATAKEDVLNYLRDAQAALREIGVKNNQVLLNRDVFNTVDSVAKNAARIVSTVEESAAKGRKVILISHSKGGNDVLAALLILQRQRKLSAIGGWISVQTGFAGSPIADHVMQSETLRKGAKLFIEELGGTIDSLNDMTTPVCRSFLAEHGREIHKLVKTVPIISFASAKPKPADFQILHPDTILAATRDMMDRLGMTNDGLVPTRSAILDGTAYIAKVGIDHAEVAMANQPPVIASQLDRKRFLYVLLSLLLKQINDFQSAPAVTASIVLSRKFMARKPS